MPYISILYRFLCCYVSLGNQLQTTSAEVCLTAMSSLFFRGLQLLVVHLLLFFSSLGSRTQRLFVRRELWTIILHWSVITLTKGAHYSQVLAWYKAFEKVSHKIRMDLQFWRVRSSEQFRRYEGGIQKLDIKHATRYTFNIGLWVLFKIARLCLWY